MCVTVYQHVCCTPLLTFQIFSIVWHISPLSMVLNCAGRSLKTFFMSSPMSDVQSYFPEGFPSASLRSHALKHTPHCWKATIREVKGDVVGVVMRVCLLLASTIYHTRFRISTSPTLKSRWSSSITTLSGSNVSIGVCWTPSRWLAGLLLGKEAHSLSVVSVRFMFELV